MSMNMPSNVARIFSFECLYLSISHRRLPSAVCYGHILFNGLDYFVCPGESADIAQTIQVVEHAVYVSPIQALEHKVLIQALVLFVYKLLNVYSGVNGGVDWARGLNGAVDII